MQAFKLFGYIEEHWLPALEKVGQSTAAERTQLRLFCAQVCSSPLHCDTFMQLVCLSFGTIDPSFLAALDCSKRYTDSHNEEGRTLLCVRYNTISSCHIPASGHQTKKRFSQQA